LREKIRKPIIAKGCCLKGKSHESDSQHQSQAGSSSHPLAGTAHAHWRRRVGSGRANGSLSRVGGRRRGDGWGGDDRRPRQLGRGRRREGDGLRSSDSRGVVESFSGLVVCGRDHVGGSARHRGRGMDDLGAGAVGDGERRGLGDGVGDVVVGEGRRLRAHGGVGRHHDGRINRVVADGGGAGFQC